jgi:hypothetical protein
MISVRTNLDLMNHLRTFEVDGATVDSLLFEGGRLAYPGRKEIEYQLGYTEPYTLELESRAIEGIKPKMAASIRILADAARDLAMSEPTLELLWAAHSSWRAGISLDRLVAALVMVEYATDDRQILVSDDVRRAAEILVKGLHSSGFPPDEKGLEELFDGAPPACVGLGLVEL